MSRLFSWGDKAKVEERSSHSPEHAQAMMQKAAAALERKETQTARALYSESIAIYHARNMRREEADAYHALAQMLITESQLPPAFEAYTQAIALYRKLNLRGQLAVTLRDAGYSCTDRGELQQAHDLLKESLELFEVTGDKIGMASALEGMGIASYEKQDNSNAREYFQRSLSLHRDLDLNPESAVSLIYLSIIALSENEIDSAEALYRESIDRFREDNSESSLISPLLTLGDVAFITHDSIQIAELLQAALAVFGASRLKRSWDSAMVKLGGVAQRRNVNRSALETYRHSLSIDPSRDEWGSEAIACLGLGCVAYRQDKPKIGKALIARSLNLCRTNGDVDTIRYVLSYAAAYTYRCQHYPDSCHYHVQCADAARNSGDELQAADAMCYSAFLASWLNNCEDARKYCVECVAVYRKHSLYADLARSQSLLGTIFSNLGDLETGAKIHEEAVSLSKRVGEPIGIALSLSSMGASLIKSDVERAYACLDESLRLLDGEAGGSGADAEVMQNMGELHRAAGRHEEAYRLFCASMDLRLVDSDRFGCAASLMQAGLIAVSSEQFDTGAALIGKAVSIRVKLGVPTPPLLGEELAAARERLKEALGVEACAQIVAESESMTLHEASRIAGSIQASIVNPLPSKEEQVEELVEEEQAEDEAQERETVEDPETPGGEDQDQAEHTETETEFKLNRLFPWIGGGGDRGKPGERTGKTPERAADALSEASIAARSGEMKAATKLFEESIRIYQSLGLKQDEARANHALALALASASEFTSAFEAFNASTALYRALSLKANLAAVLRDAGQASVDYSDSEQAWDQLEESLSLYTSLDDKSGIASARMAMGMAAYHDEDFSAASNYYTESLDLYTGIGYHDRAAVCLVWLSSVAIKLEDFDAARNHYFESVDRYRSTHAASPLSHTLADLGAAPFANRSEFQATELLEAAIAIYSHARTSDPTEFDESSNAPISDEKFSHSPSAPTSDNAAILHAEASACLILAPAAYSQNHGELATTLFDRALAIAKELSDADLLCYSLLEAGRISSQNEDIPASRRYYTLLNEAADSEDQDSYKASALYALASVAYQAMEIGSAVGYCEACLELFKSAGNVSATARTLALYGMLMYEQGDSETGLKLANESLALCRHNRDAAGAAQALWRIGQIARELDPVYARTCLQECIECEDVSEQQVAAALQSLAELDLDQGEIGSAFERSTRALSIWMNLKHSVGVASAFEFCAHVAAVWGDIETAVILLSRSEAIVAKLGTPRQPAVQQRYESNIEKLTSEMGAEDFEKAWSEGITLTLDEIVDEIELMLEDVEQDDESDDELDELIDEEEEFPSEGRVF